MQSVADKLKLFAAVVIVAAGVWAFYHLGEQFVLIRAGVVIVSVVAALAVGLTSGPGQAAWEFSKTARTEVRKVVWPTRRETAQATGIVLLLVLAIGIFLFVVDTILFYVIYDVILGTVS
ncbi:MAG: preprotein translocase subunit SecE [Arenicellales bacterium]